MAIAPVSRSPNSTVGGPGTEPGDFLASPPAVTLPKGGGAIRGLGEKFSTNPVTGTAALTVPIATSPGRSGFGPQLALIYDSGAGNGPFGFGWSLSLPAITRKTDKGLPQYQDAFDSDVFVLSGAEDLVPVVLPGANGNWVTDDRGAIPLAEITRSSYRVRQYRPRVEGLFARIERWTHEATGEVHWRSISRDNITTLYGKDNRSRLFDPADPEPSQPHRIFSWLICASYDDRGNAVVYEYAPEDGEGIVLSQTHEANRRDRDRSANRYLKRIKYGNRTPNRDADWQATDPGLLTDWMFEVVFDYGEGHFDPQPPEGDQRQFGTALLQVPPDRHWPVRQDPFSSRRSGFEIRTYRLCRRVLMFHHFPAELGVPDYLVRSTDFEYASSPMLSVLSRITQSGYERWPVDQQPQRYLQRSLPPLEFTYSETVDASRLALLAVVDADGASLANLPAGLGDSHSRWVDLDGDGLAGVLSEQANGWYYKRNLSANHVVGDGPDRRYNLSLGDIEPVMSRPVLGLEAGPAQFMDLAGDGQPDLVQLSGPMPGFYERTSDGGWTGLRPFASWPLLDPNDPNLRFVDLTGDGHADILITQDSALVWHPSLGEDGFDAGVRLNLAATEDEGPRLLFNDGVQAVYLADCSGDGLADLVRIRNGEVCYWPSLGYGRFGAKVMMDNAPYFDAPDAFDQRHIRLADVDGSGVTDIVYLSDAGACIYYNQSGNSWSKAAHLPQFPPVDALTDVQVLDLLGAGTACLVWSSGLAGASHRPLRYVDLMDGAKPHLLIGFRNNLGAETRIAYAPSTRFYLDDRDAGRPWVTRLPFPVHVVQAVATHDLISGNRFVTRYAYHHGYFDGEEREFRGFGMVEQWDTEEYGHENPELGPQDASNWDVGSFVPPVLTRSWFHTGACRESDHISRQFEHEYYREGDPSRGEGQLTAEQFQGLLLADTVLDSDLAGDERREAYRALKGAILRQEIYALDRQPDGTLSEASDRPYSVSERNYAVWRLQPRGQNQHAVFLTHTRETVDFHYERNLSGDGGAVRTDPRVSHAFTLKVDEFGNTERSVAVAYRRRPLGDLPTPEQAQTHLTLTVSRYANRPRERDWYRVGLPVETRTFEVVRPPEPAVSGGLVALFGFTQIEALSESLFSPQLTAPAAAALWPYEQWDWRLDPAHMPTESKLRLIEHLRTVYRSDNLASFLPLGDVQSMALVGESYRLTFTAGLVQSIYVDSGKLAGAAVTGVFSREGGYVHSEGDADWWSPSGRLFYSPETSHSAAQELAFARAHFFLPHRVQDPFGQITTLAYDGDPAAAMRNHNLLLVETKDALDNVVTARTADDTGVIVVRNDYRLLAPYWVTDANGNRTRVAFDTLGMVAATAGMGKSPALGGAGEGDTMDLVVDDANPSLATLQAFVADPRSQAHAVLGAATTRFLYDIDRFQRCGQPPLSAIITRENHADDQTPVQITFTYSDGLGRLIQTKVQAEPGDAPRRLAPQPTPGGDIGPGDLMRDAGGHIMPAPTAQRWVGSGRTVFNNKGKPVKQYEPYFSATHLYESEPEMTDTGVTPVLFYDPLGRMIATLHPNHSYEKVVFDPWRQQTFDANDNTASDPRSDPGLASFVAGYFAGQAPDWQTWQGPRRSGAHGDTPQQRLTEKDAALKAMAHAGTPTMVHFDVLGRGVLAVADNGPAGNYATRVQFDIENNQRAVIDARDRVVMRFDVDLLGNRIHQDGMDAGGRWLLHDVAGHPLRAWDDRGHAFRTEYDELRRPVRSFVASSGPGAAVEVLFQATIYGDQAPAAPSNLNLKGRVLLQVDTAGVRIHAGTPPHGNRDVAYDFKGNSLHMARRLAREYKQNVDWQAVDWQAVDAALTANPFQLAGVLAPFSAMLETETLGTGATFDALNRPLTLTHPDGSVVEPRYNVAGLLDGMGVRLPGSAQVAPFVTQIDYNAKGQRTRIDYQNGVTTRYVHDPETFRLRHMATTRPAAPDAVAAAMFSDPARVQEIHYTYDAVGNITHIADTALVTVLHDNQQVEPVSRYTYDALYRLTSASSREHIAQTALDANPAGGVFRDLPFTGTRAHPNDLRALRNYTETYTYDETGNITQVAHSADLGSWTRDYVYSERSLLQPGKQNNRLSSTKVGAVIETYSYDDAQGQDVHGCIARIGGRRLEWNFRDQVQRIELGGGGAAYYVYDDSGQRLRKVIETQGGAPREERVYLGGYEVFRVFSGGQIKTERHTLHVTDASRRIALVETLIMANGAIVNTPTPRVRYQLGNHLESVALEVDVQGRLITYEEYHPYGTSSFQVVPSQAETPAKRYRYTGKERDEESGLYYHGARYLAPWLGRWISYDPAGIAAGINLYSYARGSPVNVTDATGAWPDFVDKQLAKAQTAWEQHAPKALQEVVKGARASGADTAKETVEEVVSVSGPGQFMHGVKTLTQIATAKDPLKAAVTVAKDKITTIDPPAAIGIALVEGRGVEAGVEDALKKVPFAQPAEDLDKTVKAIEKGDAAAAVQHGIGGVRHFGKEAGRLVLAAEGGAAAEGGIKAPPELPPANLEAPGALPRMSDPAMLQQHTNDLFAQRMVNAAEQPGAYEAWRDMNPRFRRDFGNTMQSDLVESVENTPGLRDSYQAIQQRGRSVPDFLHTGEGSGRPFAELTTSNPATVARHLDRWYGPFSDLILYPALPNSLNPQAVQRLNNWLNSRSAGHP